MTNALLQIQTPRELHVEREARETTWALAPGRTCHILAPHAAGTMGHGEVVR